MFDMMWMESTRRGRRKKQRVSFDQDRWRLMAVNKRMLNSTAPGHVNGSREVEAVLRDAGVYASLVVMRTAVMNRACRFTRTVN